MRILKFISKNILFLITLFLLAFIPLYPKLPLIDLRNTWVYIRAEDFVVVLVLLLWIFLLIRKKITLMTPLTLPIILFWIIGVISTIHGVLLIFPLIDGVYPNIAFLNYLRRIEYLSLFFVAYSGMREKRFIPYVVAVISITLLLVAGYGFGQKLLGFPAYLTMNEEFAKGTPLRLSQLSRISSTFAGHYDLAAYLVLIVPIITSIIFAVRNLFIKFFLSIAVGLGFVLMFMTVSRVSFFVLFVSMVLALLFQKKKLIILSLFLVTLVLMIFSPSLLQRFGNTVKEVDVLVSAKTGEVIGHVKEVPSENFENKDIKLVFAESKSEITSRVENKNIDESASDSAKRVPLYISPSVPFIVQSNSSTGENLSQGTGYINLSLSPITKRTGYFIYQKANDGATTEEPMFSVHGDFIIKKALAYDLSYTTRFQGEWPNAIKAFKRNILLGSGYSSVSLAVDNNYLRILGEAGLLGFTSFFGIFLIVGIYIRRLLPEVDSPVVRNFVLGFIAGFFGLVLNAVLIDVFEASKIAFILWLLIGIILGVLNLYQKKEIDIYKDLKKLATSSYAVVVFLFIIAVILFSQILNYYFVGDDFTWLRWAADRNQSIITSIFNYFTNADGFFYRPGTKIYFLLMYLGFWLNQTIYHIVSIILHFMVAVILFLIFNKVLRNFRLSVLSAFLFLIMSSYAEAVFWISATGHLFNALFILLSLLFFIYWEEKKEKAYFILSFISIILGLMFHELGVIAPLLIILYKCVIEGKITIKELFKERNTLILFSPLVLYIGLRYIAQSHWFNGDYSYNILKLPFNIIGNTIGYFILSLFGPASLSTYQLIRSFSRGHLIFSMFVSVVIIYLLVMLYRLFVKKMVKEDKNIVLFGFLFFVVSLLPFLGLGNITSRYSYLASIGFILLFVFLLNKVYLYLKTSDKHVALGIIILIISIFSFLHLIQINQLNNNWHEAGAKTQRFLISIDEFYSDQWRQDSMQFYFTNVPIRQKEAWIFPVGLGDSLWFAFHNKNIQIYQSNSVDEALQILKFSPNMRLFEFQNDGSVKLIRLTKELIRLN